jgi:hypothetical protein
MQNAPSHLEMGRGISIDGARQGLRYCQLTSKQIERQIGVDGHPAQPTAELVDHQSCGNAGRVDRAPRSAASRLRF